MPVLSRVSMSSAGSNKIELSIRVAFGFFRQCISAHIAQTPTGKTVRRGRMMLLTLNWVKCNSDMSTTTIYAYEELCFSNRTRMCTSTARNALRKGITRTLWIEWRTERWCQEQRYHSESWALIRICSPSTRTSFCTKFRSTEERVRLSTLRITAQTNSKS